MRILKPSKLLITVVLGLAPAAALAATCGDYEAELSTEQREFLQTRSIELSVPEGEVDTIRRCDANNDDQVDINDIRAIIAERNQPAAHPEDPMDADQNGVINVLDARLCVSTCSLPRCAVQNSATRSTAGAATTSSGGVPTPAECFQKEDFDGDGEEDFAAVTENTDEEQADGYNLEVVILSKNANNEVQLITYPFTGQSASETGGELTQHLSVQPPGVVDLDPGTLVLEKPGFISYRNGEPNVIFYYVDGQVQRAFYGIDD